MIFYFTVMVQGLRTSWYQFWIRIIVLMPFYITDVTVCQQLSSWGRELMRCDDHSFESWSAKPWRPSDVSILGCCVGLQQNSIITSRPYRSSLCRLAAAASILTCHCHRNTKNVSLYDNPGYHQFLRYPKTLHKILQHSHVNFFG